MKENIDAQSAQPIGQLSCAIANWGRVLWPLLSRWPFNLVVVPGMCSTDFA